MDAPAFHQAARVQTSLVAPVERKLLLWLAARIPLGINPDHLTVLGALAMLAAGVCYYLSQWNPLCLHLVNLSLAVNWFGDSLDGTLARYRRRQRPRYGFYVDHIIDAFGTASILLGLAWSGLIHLHLGYMLLILYLILSINVYLATHTLGTFTLSFWLLSPTEGRILLALANLIVLFHPVVTWSGHTLRVFDLIGGILCAVLITITLVSVVRNIAALYRAEPSDPSFTKG
jgi:phosphatidylglycerophosphate synthase